MMHTQLTIIIPFLNEGEEIANTLSSIKDTTTSMPSILLINDASTDEYDYRTVAEQYNCEYIQHEVRLGVAESRNEGVRTCTTPYFLLLDGHMRFYEKGWDEKLSALLQKNPRTILCGQTKKLLRNENGEIVEGEHKTCYGAYIDMSEVRIFKAAELCRPYAFYSTVRNPLHFGCSVCLQQRILVISTWTGGAAILWT